MGFISDRLAADRVSSDYVKRLVFPGIETKVARKSQAAIKEVVERGFFYGMNEARASREPQDDEAERFVNELKMPEGTPPDATTRARLALKLAFSHGAVGGARYGREHPK